MNCPCGTTWLDGGDHKEKCSAKGCEWEGCENCVDYRVCEDCHQVFCEPHAQFELAFKEILCKPCYYDKPGCFWKLGPDTEENSDNWQPPADMAA